MKRFTFQQHQHQQARKECFCFSIWIFTQMMIRNNFLTIFVLAPPPTKALRNTWQQSKAECHSRASQLRRAVQSVTLSREWCHLTHCLSDRMIMTLLWHCLHAHWYQSHENDVIIICKVMYHTCTLSRRASSIFMTTSCVKVVTRCERRLSVSESCAATSLPIVDTLSAWLREAGRPAMRVCADCMQAAISCKRTTTWSQYRIHIKFATINWNGDFIWHESDSASSNVDVIWCDIDSACCNADGVWSMRSTFQLHW